MNAETSGTTLKGRAIYFTLAHFPLLQTLYKHFAQEAPVLVNGTGRSVGQEIQASQSGVLIPGRQQRRSGCARPGTLSSEGQKLVNCRVNVRWRRGVRRLVGVCGRITLLFDLIRLSRNYRRLL